MNDQNARRTQLEDRLQELGARLVEIDASLDEPPSQDDEDRATIREDDEVLETVAQSGLREIEMIRAALRRFETGEYGICQSCGERIPEERLDAVPSTLLCVDCAQAASSR